MKSEIILQVTEQITDFAGSVKQSLGNLPAPRRNRTRMCSQVFMTISQKRDLAMWFVAETRFLGSRQIRFNERLDPKRESDIASEIFAGRTDLFIPHQ